MVNRIGFLTGTRADYGKIKPLLQELVNCEGVKPLVLVTGMHRLPDFGSTVDDIRKDGLAEIHEFPNQVSGDRMEFALATTIQRLSPMVRDLRLDMLMVHGDRVEALAGAIVGSLNNILVGHLEGGEVSGSIDGSIRHAVSKLSHAHFVANEEAAKRLRQLGESDDSIFVIGSPDVDVMLRGALPHIDDVKQRYLIPFKDYAILVFHPVTTELTALKEHVDTIVKVVCESPDNYLVIGANNDQGTDVIAKAFEPLRENGRCKVFPSIEFESFLSLLRNARYIMGNSSAGVREAQYLGVPAINIGSRQKNRSRSPHILNVSPKYDEIMTGIGRVDAIRATCVRTGVREFGDGRAATLFRHIITDRNFWKMSVDKTFIDRSSVD